MTHEQQSQRIAEIEAVNAAQQELIERFTDLQGITALRCHIEFGEHLKNGVRFAAACPTALDVDITARAEAIITGVYEAIAAVAGGLQAKRIAELEASLAAVTAERDALRARLDAALERAMSECARAVKAVDRGLPTLD